MTYIDAKTCLYGEYASLRPQLEVPNGWLYKVGEMIKEIETYCIKNKISGSDITVTQIKEKYNTLRVYFYISEKHNQHYEIIENGIVRPYQEILNTTCMFCGCTQSSYRKKLGIGYIMCNECADERGFGASV